MSPRKIFWRPNLPDLWDFIWKQGLHRCNQGKINSFLIREEVYIRKRHYVKTHAHTYKTFREADKPTSAWGYQELGRIKAALSLRGVRERRPADPRVWTFSRHNCENQFAPLSRPVCGALLQTSTTPFIENQCIVQVLIWMGCLQFRTQFPLLKKHT